MHHENDMLSLIMSERAWNEIGRKIDSAHSHVLEIPGKGLEHKICEQFSSYCHIRRLTSLATWVKLGGISHNINTLWHSECTFFDCRVIEGYVQTCSDAQRWIYIIVISASCHPSKRDKGWLDLASFARMAAGRNDNAVYPPLGFRTCLFIPLNDFTIEKNALRVP